MLKLNDKRNCQIKVFPVQGVLRKQVTRFALLLSNDRTTIGGQPLMYILKHIKYDTGSHSVMYIHMYNLKRNIKSKYIL